MEAAEIVEDGLLLRPWRATDADAVHRACQDPDVRRWTGVPRPYRRADAVRFVTALAPATWADGSGAPFAVCDAATGDLLGSCGVVSVDRTVRSGEVGYWTAVAALVAAALAAVAGMVDLWDVPGGHTRRTAVTFNLVNAAMAGLFLLACLIRAEAPNRGASGTLLAVELVALAVGAVGVGLGSRLVRQFESGRAEAGTFEAIGGVDATVELSTRRL
ncbi:N-acetyltransferase [Micromonospora fluostatini]|uniref:N-acetyltransferase n=1 Tax=Micromonospora fluostatini TaxID=1629071 RepID=A0ABY2DHB9_9ACTN|nr:N-acetyltransferase [Micromonospora fluostatini]